MADHHWNDDWEHWDDLYKGIRYFSTNMDRFRGPWFLTKEKYGTMRIEYFYWNTNLDCWLLRKNCVMYHYPKLRKISAFFDYILEKLRLIRLISIYMRFVFNMVTMATIRKFPTVREELLMESYFTDLLYPWVKKKINYEDQWITLTKGKN